MMVQQWYSKRKLHLQESDIKQVTNALNISQAEGRGFESRIPLNTDNQTVTSFTAVKNKWKLTKVYTNNVAFEGF